MVEKKLIDPRRVTALPARLSNASSNRSRSRTAGVARSGATLRRANFCEQGRDATFAQALPMRLGTVAPVALNDLRLVQGTSPFAPDMWNGLDQCIELGHVVAVCAGQDDRERDALRVDDEVVLAAELASVRGIRAGFFPASMARMDELSTMARVKSISPRRRSSASSISWIRCQTPACCHATSRRQQAVPEPQPISCGSRFHAMSERSTNTMPVSTARSGVGLRPAYWRCAVLAQAEVVR
jgi:hypothetical protein